MYIILLLRNSKFRSVIGESVNSVFGVIENLILRLVYGKMVQYPENQLPPFDDLDTDP